MLDAPSCGGAAHTAIDSFEDDALMRRCGAAFEGTLSRHGESRGRLVINVAANSSDDWAGYVTTNTYELADSPTFVEVPQLSAADTNTLLLVGSDLAATNGASRVRPYLEDPNSCALDHE